MTLEAERLVFKLPRFVAFSALAFDGQEQPFTAGQAAGAIRAAETLGFAALANRSSIRLSVDEPASLLTATAGPDSCSCEFLQVQALGTERAIF